MDQTLLVTTSWDDGDPADLRLAETLMHYGFRGTFYICRDREGRARVSDAEISELATMPEVEVGSHTLTHPNLRRLPPPQVDMELVGSKSWLEDLVGERVTSFCYPSGSHRRRLIGQVAAAGYSVGRTTMSGHTEPTFDPLLMPTTMQMYPHTQLTQLRHALKECDLLGLRNLLALGSWSSKPVERARRFVEQARGAARQSAMIHIWGHSWELDEAGLWPDLEDILKYLRDIGSAPKTNRELAQLATTPEDVQG